MNSKPEPEIIIPEPRTITIRPGVHFELRYRRGTQYNLDGVFCNAFVKNTPISEPEFASYEAITSSNRDLLGELALLVENKVRRSSRSRQKTE